MNGVVLILQVVFGQLQAMIWALQVVIDQFRKPVAQLAESIINYELLTMDLFTALFN